MEKLNDVITAIDDFVWGPVMLILLVGTGIFLTIRTRFLTWRNLGYALKSTLSKEARTKSRGEGDVSPFSALTTALAATIGTGNIVGVATAMVSGGPGALVWMWISAAFGLTSKFGECMLAIKYREINAKGEMSGGPMYTMKKALKNKRFGAVLAWLFALFAVIASFGIGNMTQGNSISGALHTTFHVPTHLTGIVITVLALLIIVGGIKSISKVSSVVVPLMAIFYVICGVIVIIGNISNLPAGILMIFQMAFSVKAVGGGLCGTIVASMMNAMRYGVARGVFSNEAGMGSTPHAHAMAKVKTPHEQGVVAMIGVFIDTFLVLTMTALVVISTLYAGNGPLAGGAAEGIDQSNMAQLAFSSVFGEGLGSIFVAVCLLFFAFSTILSWNLFGKINANYLFGRKNSKLCSVIYTIIALVFIFLGTVSGSDFVWELTDMFNNLIVLPNVIALFALTGMVIASLNEVQKDKLKV